MITYEAIAPIRPSAMRTAPNTDQSCSRKAATAALVRATRIVTDHRRWKMKAK